MKKIVFAFSLLALTSTALVSNTQAQDAAKTAAAAPATTLKPENLKFKTLEHDFGSVKEGDPAEYYFDFKNTGKEPLVLQHVQASCGCTTPEYDKEPVKPGKSGKILVKYSTSGRVGPINKTVTVTSNAGQQVLHITGTVIKAPASSVPSNESVLKNK